MKDERTPILEVENLKMTFVSGKRGRKVTVNAIDDNSFKVYEGETIKWWKSRPNGHADPY